jgi:hypothetical protein
VNVKPAVQVMNISNLLIKLLISATRFLGDWPSQARWLVTGEQIFASSPDEHLTRCGDLDLLIRYRVSNDNFPSASDERHVKFRQHCSL